MMQCDDAKQKRTKDMRLTAAIATAFVILIVVFYGGVNLYGYFEERKEKRIYNGEKPLSI